MNISIHQSRLPNSPFFTIEEGDRSDYARLAPHHYIAGPPATFDRILRAVDQRDGPIGILIVSRAPLNTAWRRIAWPNLFSNSRAITAKSINDHIRRISRVIIDPRFRGLGLATRLVRAYLREPLTAMTEAVAAMGCVSPFFSHAGMRRIESAPITKRDQRLTNALASAGIQPWELLDLATTLRLLRTNAAMLAAARGWANDSRHSRRSIADTRNLANELMFAAARLESRAAVFVTP